MFSPVSLAHIALSVAPITLALASCSINPGVDSPSPTPTASQPSESGFTGFAIQERGTFEEPWASAFIPGTDMLFITEKVGTAKVVNTGANTRTPINVTGLPEVDYGGQGGLGDVAFLPSEASDTVNGRTIYLSWVEAGSGDTRGAVVGRGTLTCSQANSCSVNGLDVIWRQEPKVTGRGHFSHRIAFSPDERYMFVASGERQKKEPAQDLSNTLGTIVRLNLDGTPAQGNPFADRGGVSDQIWSYGHRNILGLDFDSEGRLWEIEHGPQGGDELNLVERGANYGWPVRSNGVNYDGSNIPDHSADDGFAKPAISWTPVIAPGNMVFLEGQMFEDWEGDVMISGLKPENLVRVRIEGNNAREVARYDMDNRIRSVIEGPDGALWVLEDGENGRLLRLTPKGS
ncbi:PQQ-dependent sugar dehydrogenase [Qipengyuania atrilutea]|uniref:PQQ-dependent sugar dehydrogenase n=1 Tax=Qipengyuania atrilutea TaxID=2744473 RepID=A0A850H690_9SPHN|nr:PQQ-dependent sugar dehydrogenase [Actirhodobacter atriluteus]NVD45682.1 PQQ-dependent sugar dehydrogenase [Actirhodobacter atriluteus]